MPMLLKGSKVGGRQVLYKGNTSVLPDAHANGTRDYLCDHRFYLKCRPDGTYRCWRFPYRRVKTRR